MATRGGRVVRGTSNGNQRGSSYARRARKAWLLTTFGDGEKAPCWRCAAELTFETLTVDRILPGARGGAYRRDNIRPACGPCNSETGGAVRRPMIAELVLEYRRAAAAVRRVRFSVGYDREALARNYAAMTFSRDRLRADPRCETLVLLLQHEHFARMSIGVKAGSVALTNAIRRHLRRYGNSRVGNA